jgi:transglutaminase-like putative cysteine protease
LQGAGNSFDQALLLSSLLRESGIQTRYVYGKIEVSADDAAKWLRSENATQAANFFVSSGIPTTCRIDGYSGDVVLLKMSWEIAS